MFKVMMAGAVALGVSGIAAHAATYTYDFKKEANASGNIGEAIFDEFDTSTNGVFVGPNLRVTATKNQQAAFVYFDNGNAGMGVCGVSGGSLNTYNPGSGANLCNPGSDDGLTTTTETLHFQATNKALRITEFYINSNHDNAPVQSTVWNIGGIEYSGPYTEASLSQSGDIKISVNFLLNVGDTLTLAGVSGPNSYISGIGLAPVPLPAPALMLLTGLGGLGMMRKLRGRKAA
jgi:hypothetical protein